MERFLANQPPPQSGAPSRLVIGLLALVCSCLALSALTLAMRPPPIHSHEDQIADLLRQQKIAFTTIALGERWPDRINFQYGANVFPYGYRIQVGFPSGAVEQGWLECAALERDCTFTLRSHGLTLVPVQDIRPPEPLPLPTWLHKYVARLLP